MKLYPEDEEFDVNKFLILTDLTTGQMIDELKNGDIAQYKCNRLLSEQNIVVSKNSVGAIVVDKNEYQPITEGKELQMDRFTMMYKWTIYRPYVTFYEATKAHNEDNKTITYHHDDELKYTFKHTLETGQFEQVSNDNLCLHELIQGNWTIDN